MRDLELGKASIEAEMINSPPAVLSLMREVQRSRMERRILEQDVNDQLQRHLRWIKQNKAGY